MRVLVVEDNPKIAKALEGFLESQGYAVDVCLEGYAAEEQLASGAHDLVVLDLMLPDIDGVELCRNARRMGLAAPILVLTALSGTAQKVAALDAGADDYLTKPFEFEELGARARALLRRTTATEAASLTFEDLELDLRGRKVRRGDEPIELTAREFSLLEFFLRNEGRVLSRAELMESAWDMRYEPESNVVDVYVSSLRKKIDKPFDRTTIHTVIGAGYRLGGE